MEVVLISVSGPTLQVLEYWSALRLWDQAVLFVKNFWDDYFLLFGIGSVVVFFTFWDKISASCDFFKLRRIHY